MKYKIILLFIIITSCSKNYSSIDSKSLFNSKGFAYIYNERDFEDKIIQKKMNNNILQLAHNKLKPGSLIKLVNLKTNESIILKNDKRFQYPDFYKILITEPVAVKLNLNSNLPLVEIIEVKKNKSFVAQKTKIFQEEKKIYSNAPIESVKIDNISKSKKNKSHVNKDKFFIVIGEFYSSNSAKLLKKRITDKLTNFDSKKLNIKIKKKNKITLFSGPYTTINLMKNDYIQLKSFGFEELDISINE